MNKSDKENEDRKAKLDFSVGNDEIIRDVSNILGKVKSPLYNILYLKPVFVHYEYDVAFITCIVVVTNEVKKT